MASLVFFILLSMVASTPNSVKVQAEMQSHISLLIREYLRQVDLGELVEPRIIHSVVVNIQARSPPVMLPVLLRDPLTQFPGIFNGLIRAEVVSCPMIDP